MSKFVEFERAQYVEKWSSTGNHVWSEPGRLVLIDPKAVVAIIDELIDNPSGPTRNVMLSNGKCISVAASSEQIIRAIEHAG